MVDEEHDDVTYGVRQSPRRIGCVIAAVIVIVGLIGSGILAAVFLPKYMTENNKAERTQAEAMLLAAMTGIEAYKGQNEDVYSGITAAKVSKLVSKVKVVDGSPSAGQVGISDYNAHKVILIYAGQSGKNYMGTVENGSIEFDF